MPAGERRRRIERRDSAGGRWWLLNRKLAERADGRARRRWGCACYRRCCRRAAALCSIRRVALKGADGRGRVQRRVGNAPSSNLWMERGEVDRVQRRDRRQLPRLIRVRRPLKRERRQLGRGRRRGNVGPRSVVRQRRRRDESATWCWDVVRVHVGRVANTRARGVRKERGSE